ncbi:ADP-heptose:LPS heptosyltransferase [Pontibacter ummariensis]|uniref:ADP-heptose:LPS heptosyltransferase n=1 Tax=Pontibacter ummariensis TaxID=1610492 RepID=A0A239BAR8_9BACT|nr:glycosyltransferase family 9 protein [Pontibacter ummariensis]PRY16436.1 ADP-heptose:LPS heptosyltransferase [Pontibacter ummariensis]SNS05115.1 ADP-heptose:LPS heptosyltransferase [Pontibacter ummariensis]
MPKILIIRFSSIGDIVLTTPVIRCIKQQLADATVHYVTKPAFRSILEQNPYVDKVHVLSGSLKTLIQELKDEQFDYVVDLHNNLRSRVIRARVGSPGKSFYKLNYEKWLMVNFKLNRLPDVHIVQRYLDAAVSLGVKDDGEGLDYFIPARDEVDLQTLPAPFRQGYAAFAIGAQHYTKRLPTERIIELCERLQQPVILLGGKEDIATGAEIAAHFEARTTSNEQRMTVYNACGKYNLNGSASLVRQADFVVSHDTGLMHIAAAFQKDVISIWGNTIPEFGMYPFRTNYKVLEVHGLSCRPCSKIGYKKCPKGHFKCMRDIPFINLTFENAKV